MDGDLTHFLLCLKSACVIFILHQKIQKMVKCTFWYQLTRVVPDKVQRAVKCVCVCYAKSWDQRTNAVKFSVAVKGLKV